MLKITNCGRWYVLEVGEQRLILLNQKALVWHLKHKVGFDTTARASIIHMLMVETVVEIDLANTVRKVS